MYGNRRGIELLNTNEELERRQQPGGAVLKLQEEVKTLQSDVKNLQNKIDPLEKQVEQLQKRLTFNDDGFLKIRSRFIKTFKRDKMKMDILPDIINEGNEVPHHGDVVADATLHTCGRRTDEFIFTVSYGINCYPALKLGKNLEIVNSETKLIFWIRGGMKHKRNQAHQSERHHGLEDHRWSLTYRAPTTL